MEIKMIVMDIDGTLLSSNGIITTKTKELLMELQKQGVPLVLASGRTKASLTKISSMLDMTKYSNNAYIMLNGMELYDYNKELLYSYPSFTCDDAMYFAKLCKHMNLDMVLFYDEVLLIVEYAGAKITDGHFLTSNKKHLNDVSEEGIKGLGSLKKIAITQHSNQIKAKLPTLLDNTKENYEVVCVEPDWVEVTPVGVNKGNALLQLAKLKNIPIENVVAFGNSENDIEMLKVAGVGVAMGNAFEHVKMLVDDVCDSNDNDGIAKYLLKHKFSATR